MESYQYNVQSNYTNYRSSWIITFFVAFSMLLLSCNKLISIPLDKVVLSIIVLFYIPGAIKLKAYAFTAGEKKALLMLCIVTLLSLMANSNTFSFQLFLPVVGFIFSIYLSQSSVLLKGIYYGSFMHILIGNIFSLSWYAFGTGPFVSNLGYKGMPMLNSALGFTATPQCFGTLCLSWLVIYFFYR
ncbi:MAG TPA: hypothetical protein VN040_25730, partial [Pseudosphingobacterium sp.]|nr:hypothetical protein [Pseudosphingobacterium sp.]